MFQQFYKNWLWSYETPFGAHETPFGRVKPWSVQPRNLLISSSIRAGFLTQCLQHASCVAAPCAKVPFLVAIVPWQAIGKVARQCRPSERSAGGAVHRQGRQARLDQQQEDLVVKTMSCPVPFILSHEDNDLLPPQSKWHVRAVLRGG